MVDFNSFHDHADKSIFTFCSEPVPHNLERELGDSEVVTWPTNVEVKIEKLLSPYTLLVHSAKQQRQHDQVLHFFLCCAC